MVEPEVRDGDDKGGWPVFLLSLTVTRDELVLKGDADSWPGLVTIQMQDQRARLLGRVEWFDLWVVEVPPDANGHFTVSKSMVAGWLEKIASKEGANWRAVPDLEVEVRWGDNVVTVPVVFEDKHLFPVVETRVREDEQSLISWFLGLLPAGELESTGFAHSIDPIPGKAEVSVHTSDILSYLIRDFVHALPGIKNRLAEASMTETGLRSALLGPRSPVALAREALRAFKERPPGRPRKTPVATAFQLAELKLLLQAVPLPEMAEGVAEGLRTEAIAEVVSLLDEVLCELPRGERPVALRAYLETERGPA